MGDQVHEAPLAEIPAARWTASWRWWGVVAAVLTLGFAYELIRYQHSTTGQLPAIVVGAILVVGLVLAVSSPGRKRLARAAVGLALAIGILFVAAHLRTTSDPLVGDWTATADNLSPTPVTITVSALGYTLRSRAPARIGDSSCELPAGTVLGTLTGTAPTYHGQQLVASPGDCNWTGWEPMVLTSDGTTLHGQVPSGHNIVLTRQG